MQMCPDCDRVYDPTEWGYCPYCTGQLEEEHGERYYKDCPNCGGIMYWDETWYCTNCGEEIESGEDDNNSIIEY